ncbi:MAG: hypothetical protein U5N26_06015 [Candidatus Marinimicrobia bacterium]|nr:hypothetical protein [Candidatus Neomarinimicrobiota bacterium]
MKRRFITLLPRPADHRTRSGGTIFFRHALLKSIVLPGWVNTATAPEAPIFSWVRRSRSGRVSEPFAIPPAPRTAT